MILSIQNMQDIYKNKMSNGQTFLRICFASMSNFQTKYLLRFLYNQTKYGFSIKYQNQNSNPKPSSKLMNRLNGKNLQSNLMQYTQLNIAQSSKHFHQTIIQNIKQSNQNVIENNIQHTQNIIQAIQIGKKQNRTILKQLVTQIRNLGAKYQQRFTEIQRQDHIYQLGQRSRQKRVQGITYLNKGNSRSKSKNKALKSVV